jgi:signal transduction histidine kinase
MPDPENSMSPPQHQAKVQAHAVDLLYQRLGATQLHLFLMPTVIAYAMWSHVNHAVVMGWLLIIFVIYAIRLALAAAYKRRKPVMDDAKRWADYFTHATIFSGITWGAAGVLFFLPDSAGHLVLLYTSIMGLAAGSMIVTAYWLPGFYAMAIPAISMSAARLAYEGTFEYQGLGVLMMMYLSIIIMVGRNQKQSAYEAIQLRFENLDLIDQLRDQKQVAENANIAKSKFLAAASHDLRQPLHALTLFVATLNEKIRFPEVRVVVDNIKHSVTALEGLFNALLDISRLDAGIVQPKIIAANIKPLFQLLSDEYAPQTRSQGLEWNMHCDDIAARTDPVLLETILRNLISNAIRYTPHGSIELRCRAQDDQVVIEIQDTGIGISAENQDEVFDEFVQLQNPERDRTKGLGLGLAIVKRLVNLLHHKLHMHSVPGIGTHFRIQLPIAETVITPLPETIDWQKDSSGKGLRVLVIDDEAVVLTAVDSLLSEWGYEVFVADSAEEALNSLHAAPDVIIADYRLRQNLTGIEAIHAVHARWGSHIPALIITGDTGPEQLREASQSGYSLLHKPVQPGRLRAFLRQVARGAGKIVEP